MDLEFKFCGKYPVLARKCRNVMILFSWGQYSLIRGGESLRKFRSDRTKNLYIPGDQTTFHRMCDYKFV